MTQHLLGIRSLPSIQLRVPRTTKHTDGRRTGQVETTPPLSLSIAANIQKGSGGFRS